jgi:hypothetical protein
MQKDRSTVSPETSLFDWPRSGFISDFRVKNRIYPGKTDIPATTREFGDSRICMRLLPWGDLSILYNDVWLSL